MKTVFRARPVQGFMQGPASRPLDGYALEDQVISIPPVYIGDKDSIPWIRFGFDKADNADIGIVGKCPETVIPRPVCPYHECRAVSPCWRAPPETLMFSLDYVSRQEWRRGDVINPATHYELVGTLCDHQRVSLLFLIGYETGQPHVQVHADRDGPPSAKVPNPKQMEAGDRTMAEPVIK